MTISQAAKDKILSDVKTRAALMSAFEMSEKSVTNWVERDDIRLTTELAIMVLVKHTGLSKEEILVTENLTA